MCVGVCCWGRERALAFFGGSSCVSITVTSVFRPSGHHQCNLLSPRPRPPGGRFARAPRACVVVGWGLRATDMGYLVGSHDLSIGACVGGVEEVGEGVRAGAPACVWRVKVCAVCRPALKQRGVSDCLREGGPAHSSILSHLGRSHRSVQTRHPSPLHHLHCFVICIHHPSYPHTHKPATKRQLPDSQSQSCFLVCARTYVCQGEVYAPPPHTHTHTQSHGCPPTANQHGHTLILHCRHNDTRVCGTHTMISSCIAYCVCNVHCV